MPGDTCLVCGSNRSSDPSASFHRFPKDPERRSTWLCVFQLEESDIKSYSRVCSRHFPDGDVKNDPQVNLGKRFASPRKREHPRAKRAKRRSEDKDLSELRSKSESRSRSVTPALTTPSRPPQVSRSATPQAPPPDPSSAEKGAVVLVNTALVARIEALEAENRSLRKNVALSQSEGPFRVEQIKNDDQLIRFYTGFTSYVIFLTFFEFLGPVVNDLNYWGSKEGQHKRHCIRKLDPMNQLFLTLVKLKLNLKVEDLAFRFKISASVVSRYITTWICFLYHHLKEIDWVPTVEQVNGTLPHSFRKLYPNTYAIIDGSEVFIETPSDLNLQSSTWSQYKHHNTSKFLVACTPNGAISYLSPVFVGSISDVELTRESGFLKTIDDKPGISIMADRGLTIRSMLDKIGVKLNMPPFLDGRAQLPAKEIQEGRKIASLRIHVERAIGRMKNFDILKGTIPITMVRQINQIVCVCGFLSNFQPALVPPPETISESDVEDYFQDMPDDSNDELHSDEGY